MHQQVALGLVSSPETINSILSHNPQKFGRLALIQRVTLDPPGTVIAIPSYSIFQVATPTIPNAKIDLACLRGVIDPLGRFEGSVPGDCSASAGTTPDDGFLGRALQTWLKVAPWG